MVDFKLTYATMFNPPEELHTRFDQALARLKAGLGKDYGMFIDGKDVFTAEKFEDRNPADTDMLLGTFQKGDEKSAQAALAAARKAFPLWSHMKWQERVALLRKVADKIDEHLFEIGAAMAMEVGKNRIEALGDIAETADLIRYACSQMEKNDGYVVAMGKDPLVGYDASNVSVLRPYGVWLVISPFNFPAALAGGPAGAALVTGNTVVMKPATDTPWAGRLLVECFRDAGIPDGVINYVSGPGRTLGQALITCQDVDGVTFTGSFEVGMGIFRDFSPKAYSAVQVAAPHHPGIGRQEPGHRLAPCRPGTSCHRHPALGLRPARTEMLGSLAHIYRGACLRRVDRPPEGTGREVDHRRSDQAPGIFRPGHQQEFL